MAKHLARIHGTEEDKVNCPFYFKIGACRHSDRCSRLHHKPAFSTTLLIKHLYQHPVRIAEQEQQLEQIRAQQQQQQSGTGTGGTGGGGGTTTAPPPATSSSGGGGVTVDREKALEDFLVFFEDMYMEFGKYGKIDCLHVVDNLGDHMIGHCYIKYWDEEDASDALIAMNGKYYNNHLIEAEFSPVTDFREARCRDYDEECCSRGGFCNFLHVKPVPMPLIRSLEDDTDRERSRHYNNNNNNNIRGGQQRQQNDNDDRGGGGHRHRGDHRKRKRSSDRDRRSSSSRHSSSSRSERRHGSSTNNNNDDYNDDDHRNKDDDRCDRRRGRDDHADGHDNNSSGGGGDDAEDD